MRQISPNGCLFFRFQKSFRVDLKRIFIKCKPSHLIFTASEPPPVHAFNLLLLRLLLMFVACSYIVDASIKLMTSSSSERRARVVATPFRFPTSHCAAGLTDAFPSFLAVVYRVLTRLFRSVFVGCGILQLGFLRSDVPTACAHVAHAAFRLPTPKSRTSPAAMRCRCMRRLCFMRCPSMLLLQLHKYFEPSEIAFPV
jgi:hypothetical protein